MLKEIDQTPLSNESSRKSLSLRLPCLLQRQTLGVWLGKKLSRRLTKIIDDGLNLSSLLLVLYRLQVHIVLVGVIVEDVSGFFRLRACLLVPKDQVDPVMQVCRYIIRFLESELAS